MVKAVFKFTVKEDCIEEFKRIAEVLVTNARQDKGNVSYQLFHDVNDVRHFAIIEEWESQEAMEQHSKSNTSADLVPKLDATFAGEPSMNIYALVF